MATRKWLARRRGAVLVMCAFFLIPILGITALVLDLGSLQGEYQRAQATADSAAMAAADVLFQNYMSNKGLDLNNQATKAALAVAAANGYTNDGSTSVVQVNIPPTSGLFARQAGFVEVIAQHTQPRGFSRVWTSSNMSVQARAVARGQWRGQNIGILVLDPSSSASADGTGGGNFTTTANFIVDSNSPSALTTSGGGTMSAPEFDITGGYSGGGLSGKINTGVTPTPDPLAYLPQPDPSTMPIQHTGKLTLSNGSTTLQPGVYKGGISVSGQANLTLSPGIYYMDGGGFSFSGQGSLIAPGVMIYNEPQNTNDIVSITGSGKGAINVTPPSTGIYQGISIFQDRNFATNMDIGGNGNFSFLGTFYAARANLKISGSGPNNYIGSQYISWNLNLSGNGNVVVQWDANLVARFRFLGLVE